MAVRSYLPRLSRPFQRVAQLAVALGILCGSQDHLAAREPPEIVPVDESPGHPAFHRFWRKFQRAVEQRDGKFILSVIAGDIHLGYGGRAGRKDFISQWTPGDPKGPLWKELEKIIRLGGSLGGGENIVFTAPYAFWKWPDGFDIFEYVFINGRNVRFRSEPDTAAQIIRTLSWEIMKTEQNDSQAEDWIRLKAHDGQIGFVHLDFVRSSVDFRIGFSEDGKGGFKMDFLIAGD